MSAPLLAKLALVALPVGLIGLLAKSSKAKSGTGQGSQQQLDAKSAALLAAQVGQAQQLEQLAPVFDSPDNAIVAGVAKRIRDKTTLSGFSSGQIFDPGPELGQGGRFKGGPSSGPLRELQGLLLTLQGNTTRLVEWSMAMGALGFPGYAGQLQAKAEGRPVVPLGSGGSGAPLVPPVVPGFPVPGLPTIPTGPITPGTPEANALGERIAGALATKDPTIILLLADDLDKAGQKVIAEQLRQVAKDLQAAKRAADEAAAKAEEAGRTSPGIPGPSGGPSPQPATPTPTPRPTPGAGPVPSANVRRRVTVLKGEGPAQVAARLLGSTAEGNRRFRELVAENVPPKKRDKKTGGFTQLHPGEELFVPVSWPVHPDARNIGTPAPVTPPAPTPSNPTIPPAPAVRRVAVRAGEGPFQIAQRLLGAEQGSLLWRELVAANVPPKKKDPKTGGFTILNPGELLVVPENWPVTS